jgi:hypothetical protein
LSVIWSRIWAISSARSSSVSIGVPRDLGEVAAAEQRRPALAPRRDPVAHDLRAAAQPQRRVRLLHLAGLNVTPIALKCRPS